MSIFKIFISEIKYTIARFLSEKINVNYITVSYESCPNCNVDDIIELVIRETNEIVPVKVLGILAPEKKLTDKQKKLIDEKTDKAMTDMLGDDYLQIKESINSSIEDISSAWSLILELPER